MTAWSLALGTWGPIVCMEHTSAASVDFWRGVITEPRLAHIALAILQARRVPRTCAHARAASQAGIPGVSAEELSALTRTIDAWSEKVAAATSSGSSLLDAGRKASLAWWGGERGGRRRR